MAAKVFIGLLFAPVFFLACSSTRETVFVRDTVLVVRPDSIEEWLPATWGDSTHTISGEKISHGDTVIVVRYYPVEKRIYVKVKPDSVRIAVRDTLTRVEIVKEVQETPFLSKLGLIFIGLAIASGIGGIWGIAKYFKWL